MNIFARSILSVLFLTGIAYAETQSNPKLYCLGHLNPDADAILAAITAADLFGCTPVRAGKINSETRFILDAFNFADPELVKNTPDKNYLIVDFNEKSQLFAGIESQQIVGVIDHHALGGSFVGPASPIDVTIRAWGCSCTVLWDLYQKAQKTIPTNIAGIMLGAIISDTLDLTSPTTTQTDRNAYDDLARLAGVADTHRFAAEQFQAKSQTSDLTAAEILKQDYKEFEQEGIKFGIGVSETVLSTELLMRESELLEAMAILKDDHKLSYLFFFVVNPVTKQSTLLVLGKDESQLASMAFDVNVEGSRMNTSPRVSRKAEFLPALKKALSELSLVSLETNEQF